MSHMMAQKPCFLATEEWRTLPWANMPSEKRDPDHLFDIFATVPGLTAEVNDWETGVSSDISAVFGTVLSTMHSLYQWRWSWEIKNPNATWTTPSDIKPSSIFGTVTHFHEVSDAHTISIYNSVLILGIQLIRRLFGPTYPLESTVQPPLGPLFKTNSGLRLPGVDPIDPRLTAIEICQSVRFRLDSVMNSSVALGLFLPIRMAWSMLQDNAEEAEWFIAVSSLLEKRSGIEFSKMVLQNKPRGWVSGSQDKEAMGGGSCGPLLRALPVRPTSNGV